MRAINRVRVRVHGTQIEYKRDETTSSIRRNHLNAAWERAIVIYDRDRVWVTKRREKGSGDANRLRSIPRFPDSWPGNERGGNYRRVWLTWPEKLPGFATARRPRARRYAVTQLLRLRNKWRDYCFTILSLGELWLRENIWEFSALLLPDCFAGGEVHDAVSSMESTRLSKGKRRSKLAHWSRTMDRGCGARSSSPLPIPSPFHQLSQINRLIHHHVPITT